MLSNITVKSNLLTRKYLDELRRISSMEVHAIMERCMLNISFDPSRYMGLSDRQIAQWNARLFWGDRNVQMADDGREQWATQHAQKTIASFSGGNHVSGTEDAFELLWLATEVLRQNCDLPVFGAAEVVRKRTTALLLAQGFTQASIDGHLREITVLD